MKKLTMVDRLTAVSHLLSKIYRIKIGYIRHILLKIYRYFYMNEIVLFSSMILIKQFLIKIICLRFF